LLECALSELTSVPPIYASRTVRISQYCAFGPCGDEGSGGSPQSPWAASLANRVDGSFGSQFHLGVTCDELLVVATYDFGIFRHWPLLCDSAQNYEIDDIRLLRFHIDPTALGNITTSPVEGAAYYSFGLSGLLNQSSCSQGAPVFLSKPRFLDGDPALRAAITGLPAPNRQQHDTWLGIEP
jgi:hypothetical protein